MAIQSRRGLLQDFDPKKMLAGEWAVCIDPQTERQHVYMCFAPNVVKRMATWDVFEEAIRDAFRPYIEQASASATTATTKANEAKTSATNAKTSETNAKTSETNANTYATRAKSWAVGPNGSGTSGTDTNNAKYWSDRAKTIAHADIMQGATASTDGIGGFVPLPKAGEEKKALLGNGTWGDVTSEVFTGATSSANGTKGLVPAPSSGSNLGRKVLCAGGYWSVLTEFKGATTSSTGNNGLVPTPTKSDANAFLKGNGQWTNIAFSDLDYCMTENEFIIVPHNGTVGKGVVLPINPSIRLNTLTIKANFTLNTSFTPSSVTSLQISAKLKPYGGGTAIFDGEDLTFNINGKQINGNVEFYIQLHGRAYITFYVSYYISSTKYEKQKNFEIGRLDNASEFGKTITVSPILSI